MTASNVPHMHPAAQAPARPPPPGRIRYLIALLFFLAGMGGMGFILFRGISSLDTGLVQIVVPGEKQLTLEPGDYTIFHERQSVVDGRVYSSQSLGGLQLVVTSAKGEDVALKPVTITGQYTFGGRSGVSVFDFTVANGGDYTVAGRYPGSSGPDTVVAVGKGFFGGLLGMIFGGLASAFGGAGIALILFLTTLFRRRRAGLGF